MYPYPEKQEKVPATHYESSKVIPSNKLLHTHFSKYLVIKRGKQRIFSSINKEQGDFLL